MPRILQRIGVVRLALIYIILAVLAGLVLDWAAFSLDPARESRLIHYVDQLVLISISAGAFFLLLHATHTAGADEQRRHAETQSAFRQLFRAHPHPMCLLDPTDRRIMDVNDAAVRQYGWSREEFIQLRSDDVQYPPAEGNLDDYFASYPDLSEHQYLGAKQNRGRDGRPFWVEITTHPIDLGGVQLLLVTSVDISPQVEATRRYQKALQQLEDAEQVGRFGAWEWTPGESTLTISRGMANLLALPEDQRVIARQTIADRLPAEDRSRVMQSAEMALEKGHWETHIRIRSNRGELHYLRELAHRQINYDNQTVVVGSMVDETDRVRYTQELERRESELRNILEYLPAPVVIIEPCLPAEIFIANPAFYYMQGMAPGKEASISNLTQCLSEETLQAHLDLESGGQLPDHPFAIRFEARLRRNDGSNCQIIVQAASINLGERRLIQLVLHDMDQEHRLREQLYDANRRLSQLSSHTLTVLEHERTLLSRELHDDIGQLLIALKTNLQPILRNQSMQASEGIHDILDELIAKVRDRSRMLRPPQLDELGLQHAIRSELRRVLGTSTIRWHLEAGLSEAKLPTEPSTTAFRIFQEAITNAIRHASPTELAVLIDVKDDRLILSVTDNGKGFAPQSREEGLGLINMKERANLASGQLAIESQPGKGTRVEVKLPLSKPAGQGRPEWQRAP